MNPVDEFFEKLPPEERETALLLRETVRQALPEAREKLAYGVAYYSLRRRVCYIWPASVPRGGHGAGVALGFCRGSSFQHHRELLRFEGRRLVGVLLFHRPEEVAALPLEALLREAARVDGAVHPR